MRNYLLATFLVLFTLAPTMVWAADAVPEPNPPMEVRFFDVHDLISTVPDGSRSDTATAPGEPLPLRFQHIAGGYVAPPTESELRKKRLDTLIKFITDTIDQGNWEDKSSPAIRIYEGQLIVTQSHANLIAIDKLLKDLGSGRNRTLSLDAHWLLLTGEELERVTGKGDPLAARCIGLASVDKLAARAPHLAARTLMLSGEVVSLTGGRVKTAVQDLEPVPGSGVIMAGPGLYPVQAGVSLEARVSWSQDTQLATATFDSIYSDGGILKSMPPHPTTRPLDQPPRGELDRLNMPMSHLKTSAVLPLDKYILIGGATLEPATAGKAADNRRLYLIVKISLAKPQ